MATVPHSRVVLLQTIAADYNREVFEELRRQLAGDFRVFSGDEYFDPTVKGTEDTSELFVAVKNRFLLHRRLLWQSGQWRALVAAEAAVLELNPRILSTWALLLMRKLLARRTVLWGHAWPRAGRAARSVWLRQIMCRLASSVVVYTEQQARELRELIPDVQISAAPNALYSAASMRAATGDSPVNIIYVGRLVAAKKPLLLLEGFLGALPQLPPAAKLVFVGDGPERSELERRVCKYELQDRVQLLGHVSRFETLRDLYAQSLFSASPGYVGLSITQSFAFGVPMLYGRNEPHAPEIEAAKDGVNAVPFEEDNPISLAQCIVRAFADRERWIRARDEISRDCAQRYSIEVMARRLVEATCHDPRAR